MKVSHAARSVETGSTDAPVQKAKILATAGMFKIMYDKLYTRKEEAIVRELLANAWDAHVEAGNTDRPIELHLPTTLEPWFEIKDFGVGLAPEHVHRMYDYGATSKDQSSEFIGGFGIGSKTPFCYTDQFTLSSRHNGTLYTYQVFLDEDGAPACLKINEQPTIEPNGVTIHVPLGLKDWDYNSKFQYALNRMLPFLPTTPKCNDAVQIPDDQTVSFTTTDMGIAGINRVDLYDNQFKYLTEGKALDTVVMGIVPYRISSGDLYEVQRNAAADACQQTGLGNLRQDIEKLCFRIHVDIDTFEVGAGREQIESTDASRQLLRQALTRAFHAYCEDILDKLNNQSQLINWVEAFIRARRPNNAVAPTKYQSFIKHTQQGHGTTRSMNLHLTNLAIAAGAESVVGRAHRDSSLKHNYRYSSGGTNIDVAMCLKEVTVAVIPEGKAYPIHNALEQLYNDGSVGHESLLFRGDIATIRKKLKDLGFERWNVIEFPYIKRKKGERANIGGRARYPTSYAYIQLDAGRRTGRRLGKRTISENLSNLIDENDLVVLGTSATHPAILDIARALCTGLLHSKSGTRINRVIGIEVPNSHKRVIDETVERLPNAAHINDLGQIVTFNSVRHGYYAQLFALNDDRIWQFSSGLDALATIFNEELDEAPFDELARLIRTVRRYVTAAHQRWDDRLHGSPQFQFEHTVRFLEHRGVDVPSTPDTGPFIDATNARASRIAELIVEVDRRIPGFEDFAKDLQTASHWGITSETQRLARMLAQTLH